jgi:hypothetical protein
MNLSTMSDKLQALRSRIAQHANVCISIANKVNAALLLFDNQLVDLQTGRSTQVSATEPDAGAAQSAQMTHSAIALAQAANRLLADSAQTEKVCTLLLPPAEFYISETTLPAAGLDLQRAALLLQAMTVLPEFEQTLNAGFMPGVRRQALPAVRSGLAAWLPAERAENLFGAFSDNKIFLASVMPRVALFTELTGSLLPAADTESDQIYSSIDDVDQHLLSVLQHSSQGKLSYLQCSASDSRVPELNGEFLLECGGDVAGRNKLDVRSAQDYFDASPLRTGGQSAQPETLARLAAQGVFPHAAIAARHQLEQGKLRKQLLRVAMAAVLVVSLPFIWQSFQLLRLEAQLDRAQTLSLTARADQSVVRDFENDWGVFNEFPDQDIAAVLLTLQPVINPGLLSAFELNEGLLSIEGESADPQNILEQLEQNPMFTEVDFARATNNNRYFIDLRLSTVNFAAYREWHFPERR